MTNPKWPQHPSASDRWLAQVSFLSGTRSTLLKWLFLFGQIRIWRTSRKKRCFQEEFLRVRLVQRTSHSKRLDRKRPIAKDQLIWSHLTGQAVYIVECYKSSWTFVFYLETALDKKLFSFIEILSVISFGLIKLWSVTSTSWLSWSWLSD